MLVDDADRAYFICCAEGAIPLSEVRRQLQERAEALARMHGMSDPTTYARWLLRQCGFTAIDESDEPTEAAAALSGVKAQVMPDAQQTRTA